MSIRDIPFGDLAEEIAQKYLLSTVLIIAVEKTDNHSQMSWGYDGSAYEASGAASRFCHLVATEMKIGENEEELE